MIHWMILSTLATGLFYGLYCLTLRRDRWLKLSVVYLVTTLWFSVVFPWFTLPESLATASQNVIPTEGYMMTLDEIDISANAASRTINLTDIHFIGIALCLAYLLFQLGAQAIVIARLRRRHTVYKAADGFDIPRKASLILLDDDTAPYSFFNQIVVGTRGLNDDELRCILAHESHHVSHNHTYDLLAAWLLCCGAWFNPFAWLIMREIRAVHEFQADAASIGVCGREDYLHLLYRQATGTGYGHITNNFKSINLKKRIVMMNKTRTRFGAWKVLAALPVAALLMMVGCKQGAPENTVAEEEAAVVNEATVEPIIFKNDSMPEGLVAPEYPNGGEALYKYIADNIHYPEQAKADGLEGRVVVQFTVTDKGDIVNVEIAKGIGGGCDEEALRVVKGMSKWKPAIYEGKAVSVQYCIPINFKLH